MAALENELASFCASIGMGGFLLSGSGEIWQPASMTRTQAFNAAKMYYEPLIRTSVRQCFCGKWFFNPNRRWKHCSEKCALEASRRQKLDWWQRWSHLHKQV